ncbi:MAG: hypothetical protein QOE54_4348 [Streptosporangiaceae bacterium]|nr:hypothetical protein [Streptosporangiaceae bacterium]
MAFWRRTASWRAAWQPDLWHPSRCPSQRYSLNAPAPPCAPALSHRPSLTRRPTGTRRRSRSLSGPTLHRAPPARSTFRRPCSQPSRRCRTIRVNATACAGLQMISDHRIMPSLPAQGPTRRNRAAPFLWPESSSPRRSTGLPAGAGRHGAPKAPAALPAKTFHDPRVALIIETVLRPAIGLHRLTGGIRCGWRDKARSLVFAPTGDHEPLIARYIVSSPSPALPDITARPRPRRRARPSRWWRGSCSGWIWRGSSACPVRQVAYATHGQIIEVLVANRLSSPAPLLHVSRWAAEWAVEEVFGLPRRCAG